ncbi:MAG: hypothetical protein ACREVA_00050 [Burkholderiales bacterium]
MKITTKHQVAQLDTIIGAFLWLTVIANLVALIAKSLLLFY